MLKLTDKQQAYRKSLLQKIHLAPVYLDLYRDDRQAWESFLQENFNVKSSARLRINQLIRLLDFLNLKTTSVEEHISTSQIAYLRVLWKQRARNPDEKALLNFACKNTGLSLIGLQALTRFQASGLLAAIKRM